MKESSIQKAILEYLSYQADIMVWRQNVGMVRYDKGRYVRFGFAGLADIIGLMKGGRFLAIEVKSTKGKQTDSQKIFQQLVEKMGGLYVLAYDVDTVRNAIEVARG